MRPCQEAAPKARASASPRITHSASNVARTLGDGRGFEDSTLNLGRVLNNRYGLDAHAATATAWNTSIRYYGGHFACGTGINLGLDRFGVRFSRGAVDAYNNHNRHVFDAPNFELRQLEPNIAIPFLNETNGTAIIARNMRMEGCSPFRRAAHRRRHRLRI